MFTQLTDAVNDGKTDEMNNKILISCKFSYLLVRDLRLLNKNLKKIY